MIRTVTKSGRPVPELLVPAGGPEAFQAAIAGGADAIYVGGASFSARAGAQNFTMEELREAVRTAHLHDIDVHVALNTLLYGNELLPALRFSQELAECGVDALIVQDAGLISRIHREIPEIPVHLSTQGTVYDADGVREAANMGAQRAILARELTLEEIRNICRVSPIEIEVFVHGAICIALSGQCRMSGMIGGRSGNRGACAQPCRLPYTLHRDGVPVTENGYLLSPSDMSLFGEMDQIVAAGVDSIKIEGRMKSPEYVLAVTSAYRRALDAIRRGTPLTEREREQEMAVLRQIYSRGRPVSYLYGDTGAPLMSGSSPKHTGVRIGTLLSSDRKKRHVRIRLDRELSIGDGIEIRDKDGSCGNVVTYLRNRRDGQLVRDAKPGMELDVGDLRFQGKTPENGLPVYRMTDHRLMQKLQKEIRRDVSDVDISMSFYAKSGAPAMLTVRTADAEHGAEVSVKSEDLVAAAVNQPSGEEEVCRRLSKTGATVYRCVDVRAELLDDPFLPASMLNGMRRKALDQLTEKRLEKRRRTGLSIASASGQTDGFMTDSQGEETCGSRDGMPREEVELFLRFLRGQDGVDRAVKLIPEAVSAVGGAGRLILTLPADRIVTSPRLDLLLDELNRYGAGLAAELPLSSRGPEASERENMIHQLEALRDRGILQYVFVSNLSQASIVKQGQFHTITDASMNVLNEAALRFWKSWGASASVLSEEPEAECYRDFSHEADSCVVTVYGRIPAMYMDHCPIGSAAASSWKKGGDDSLKLCSKTMRHHYCRTGRWTLTDRRGAQYPVTGDDRSCRAVVYSHNRINRISQVGALTDSGFRRYRIHIFDENNSEISTILRKISEMIQKRE